MNEDSRLSFCHVGALLTSEGIPVLAEGTLLLAGSLQLGAEVPARIELASCKWLHKDTGGDRSCTADLVGQINRADTQ